MAILFSNTPGTAAGDFLADNTGLGFWGGAALNSGVLLLIMALSRFTCLSHIGLFWTAFVLARLFSATFGRDIWRLAHQNARQGRAKLCHRQLVGNSGGYSGWLRCLIWNFSPGRVRSHVPRIRPKTKGTFFRERAFCG